MQILGMTAAGLGAAIKNKEVTVMEAVEAVLSRIEEKDRGNQACKAFAVFIQRSAAQ